MTTTTSFCIVFAWLANEAARARRAHQIFPRLHVLLPPGLVNPTARNSSQHKHNTREERHTHIQREQHLQTGNHIQEELLLLILHVAPLGHAANAAAVVGGRRRCVYPEHHFGRRAPALYVSLSTLLNSTWHIISLLVIIILNYTQLRTL